MTFILTTEQVERRKVLADELRSGNWTQTNGTLERLRSSYNGPRGHCCLGVACRVAEKAGISVTTLPSGKLRGDVLGVSLAPRENEHQPAVAAYYGFTMYEQSTLVAKNDRGMSFAGIADLIESGQFR